MGAVAVVSLAGCAGSGGGSGSSGGGGGSSGNSCKTLPPPTVSFANNIQPLFTRSCAVSSACHTGPVPAQGLDLSAGKAYGAIVGVPATEVKKDLVSRGNPGRSYVQEKVDAGVSGSSSQPGVTAMPLGCPGSPTQGVCFSSDESAALRTWISECAQNN